MCVTVSLSVYATQQTIAPENDKEIVVGEQKEFDRDTGSTVFNVIDKSDTIPTYQASITVPLKVSIAVAGDGSTSVPSNYKILNYSYKWACAVTSVQAIPTSSPWTLVASGQEGSAPSKKISVQLTAGMDGTKPYEVDLGKTIDTPASDPLYLPFWIAMFPTTDEERKTGVPLDLSITAKAAPQPKEDPVETGNAFNVMYKVVLITNS